MPASKRGSRCPAAMRSRSTPWRENTCCGSQQAPRLRSSHTSLRMLVICRPWANDTAYSSSCARRWAMARRIVAEQIGQHLADYAGDVITVVIQVGRLRQAAQAGGALKLMHAAAHDFQAALDGCALRLPERCGDAHHALEIQRQVALGRQGRSVEPWRQFLRQRRRRLVAVEHGDEPAQQHQRLVGGQYRLILDRIGDTAQQVRIRDRRAQRGRQLRNRQGERTGDVRQDPVLVGLVGLSGLSAGWVSRHRTDHTSQ